MAAEAARLVSFMKWFFICFFKSER
ncbi:uncharacterized protein G2W53_006528 [Senna tora]|uniref:Uncharacterized protein n=1 Tax=Senna tora TaxID=362788 RepID=A0A835CCK7_9FABA|nr:uncharacterized protein G2W53_006528 [Senna tora]